jgi:prepilin-type N-terminal cleavage/methylation domain-containing protein
MEKVKSEKGFTLLELIFVMVIVGVLSSTLILPFMSSIKQGTRPEIYATAAYLAQKRIEEVRSYGYTTKSGSLGTSNLDDTENGRYYTEQVVTEYVSHSSGSFSTSGPSTEFIKVTVTVSNSDIPEDVSMWTILAKDFYDPDAN